jgi:hypothetical protein
MSIINTNLIEEFNLSPIDDDDNAFHEERDDELDLAQGPNTLDHYKELDKIQEALPQVSGLDASDEEFDDLATYALKAHKDLMDLAMNVEQRFCGEVASAAGNMLAHAITAKTNKIKKKLDMVNLQLKKQLADHKTKGETPDDPEPLEGENKLIDRNELLKQLLQK